MDRGRRQALAHPGVPAREPGQHRPVARLPRGAGGAHRPDGAALRPPRPRRLRPPGCSAQRLRGAITEAGHVFVEEETLGDIRAAGDAWRNTQLPEKLRRYRGAKTHALLHAWHDTWLAPEFRDWNIEDCLPGIRCPLLVIQGRDDEYATEAQVEAIARQAGGPVVAMMVPHCGHIPHHQAREPVLEAMTRFPRTLISNRHSGDNSE